MNYKGVFIQVAEDTPATEGMVPLPRAGKPTIALLQYELISANPYHYTQEDVLFLAAMQHAGHDLSYLLSPESGALRAEYFAKDRPCLRSSALSKTYGWGFDFDEEGRVGLVSLESEKYQQLLNGPDRRQLRAMRTKRK